jgi:hypothetical protein
MSYSLSPRRASATGFSGTRSVLLCARSALYCSIIHCSIVLSKVGGSEIADRLTGNCRPDPLTFYFFVFSTGSVSEVFLHPERQRRISLAREACFSIDPLIYWSFLRAPGRASLLVVHPPLARIAHTCSSRSGGRAVLTRRATETDAGAYLQYAEEVEGSATPSGRIILHFAQMKAGDAAVELGRAVRVKPALLSSPWLSLLQPLHLDKSARRFLHLLDCR